MQYDMPKLLTRLDLQFFAEEDGYYIDPDSIPDFDFGEPEEPEEFYEDEIDQPGVNEEDPEIPPEEPTFEIDGRTFTASQIRALELAQQQTPHLQQQAQQAQQQAQLLAQQKIKEYEEQYAPYKQLDELFLQNPQLEQQFIQLLQQNQYQEQAQQFSFQKSPEFQQLKSQLETQNQFIERMQRQQEDAKIQQEWDQLFSRYPDAKDIGYELAQFADSKKVDLETAYRVMMFDKVREQTKQETQKELVKNQMKRKSAGTLSPNVQTGAKEKKEIPGSDGDGYDSIVNYLLKQNINL